MLDDGIERDRKALASSRNAAAASKGKPDVSIQDRQRVAVLLAEAKVQRADARRPRREALAGLRALTGVPDADLDDAELAAIERAMPGARRRGPPAAGGRRAGPARAPPTSSPRWRSASYFPDIALVGVRRDRAARRASTTRRACSPTIRTTAAAPGSSSGCSGRSSHGPSAAQVDRARADAHKAHAQSELAELGARYDADNALADATAAHDKVDAAAAG